MRLGQRADHLAQSRPGGLVDPPQAAQLTGVRHRPVGGAVRRLGTGVGGVLGAAGQGLEVGVDPVRGLHGDLRVQAQAGQHPLEGRDRLQVGNPARGEAVEVEAAAEVVQATTEAAAGHVDRWHRLQPGVVQGIDGQRPATRQRIRRPGLQARRQLPALFGPQRIAQARALALALVQQARHQQHRQRHHQQGDQQCRAALAAHGASRSPAGSSTSRR